MPRARINGCTGDELAEPARQTTDLEAADFRLLDYLAEVALRLALDEAKMNRNEDGE